MILFVHVISPILCMISIIGLMWINNALLKEIEMLEEENNKLWEIIYGLHGK